MNSKLNKMLDKYELMSGKQMKKDLDTGKPHRLIGKELELNEKII